MFRRFPILLLLIVISQPLYAARLMVFGDSLSAGYGLQTSPGWVSMLQQSWQQQGWQHEVINASVSGETTVGALQRLPQALEEHQPDLVLIELGGNDGLRGFSLKTLEYNLNQLVSLVKQSGARAVLTEIRIPPNYGPRYTQRFTQLFTTVAEQQAVPLMPFFLDEIALQPTLMQGDGIHPNDAAQPAIREQIEAYLTPIISQL